MQNVPPECVSGEIRSYASAVRFVILSFVSGWSQGSSGGYLWDDPDDTLVQHPLSWRTHHLDQHSFRKGKS